MEIGADPQAGLEAGAVAGSMPIVTAALDRGADPRRNGCEALVRVFSVPVNVLVQAMAKKLDRADFTALGAGLTVERLRAASGPLGRTGFMTAAAAGELAQALKIFDREGAALTPADLAAPDQGGYTTLKLLCDRGQAGLLLDRSLWLLREQEYLEVFQGMPKTTQEELAARHNEVLSGLKSHRDTVRLRSQAEEHRKRFRPK